MPFENTSDQLARLPGNWVSHHPQALEGWEVELAWAEVDGRMECVGLAIVGDGTEPLQRVKHLRKIPLTTLILDERRFKAFLSEDPTPDETEAVLAERAKFNAPRTRYDDDHYQAVADAYDHAWRNDLPPTAYVQEKLKLRTRTQAGKQVARARERGLLPPTEQRVPKGNT